MVLDATPGSASANAYCTVVDANTLLRLSMNPDLATEALQVQLSDALIWATRLIDEQVAWYGTPVTPTQALAWPQADVVDPLGRAVSAAIIPAFLKQATAEYALVLLHSVARHAAAMTATATIQGLKSLTIQDVRIESAVDMHEQLSTVRETERMPAAVRRLLRPYGAVAGDAMIRLLRT